MKTSAVLQLLLSAIRAEQRTTRQLRTLSTQLDTIMSILTEVQAEVVALKANAVTLQASIDTVQEMGAAAFARLQAAVEAGNTDPALAAVLEDLKAINAAVAFATEDVSSTPIPADPTPAAE